jgi:hypothetical protein
MFPVRYELGFYVLEDGILHSHRHESLNTTFQLKFPIRRGDSPGVALDLRAALQWNRVGGRELDSSDSGRGPARGSEVKTPSMGTLRGVSPLPPATMYRTVL